MAIDKQSTGIEVAFEAPLYDSAKGLVGLMFMQIDKVTALVKDPTFNPTDGRLELLINHLISAFIPEIEEQDKLRKDMDALIEEYTKNINDNTKKGIARNKACLVFEGKVIARLHDLFGTTKRNRVGFTWDPEECKVVDFR